MPFFFILDEIKFKYFSLDFTHLKQRYQLFFESYEELVNFYKILRYNQKKISRSFFLNTKKIDAILKFFKRLIIVFKNKNYSHYFIN